MIAFRKKPETPKALPVPSSGDVDVDVQESLADQQARNDTSGARRRVREMVDSNRLR